MKPRLRLLLISGIAWVAAAGFLGMTPAGLAQSSSGSSRSDSGGREENRDQERDRSSRSRFGSRGDWRSGRSRGDDEHRGEERRSEERSSSSGSSSTNSTSASGSSRSASSTSPTPSTSASTSATSASSNLNLKKWATDLVAKNDKNGDNILQPDEQRALGSSAAGEDLDHDGNITIDELVMHHSAGAAAAAPVASTATPATSTTSDSGRSSDRDRSRGGSYGDSRSKTDDPMAKRIFTGTAGGTGKDADKRHSYRFSRATDKLPTGLPSFFSRDVNKDGQVSMSEFSRSMSQSVVSEFRRYDTNDDGLITAREAARKK